MGDAGPCATPTTASGGVAGDEPGGGSPATPPRQRPVRPGVTRCPGISLCHRRRARRRRRRSRSAGRATRPRARHTGHRRRPARRAVPISVTRPSSTTATRSASCAVCSRCAIATTVRPSTTAASDRSRWRAARGSSSDVASSSTRVCGSASTRRASATCCDWASPSAWPPLPTTVSSPRAARSAHSCASTARSARLSSSRVAPGPGQQEVVGEGARRTRGAPG